MPGPDRTLAAPPTPPTLSVPGDWRALDFISDLHLCAALPRTLEAFAAHLRHTKADAVVVLGDLFDAWVGDDLLERNFERHCIELLTHAARTRRLFFMPGNRDFLLGPALVAASGMTLLADPTCLHAWGRAWLLTHGDALCLDDGVYQAFRAASRTPAWQRDFLTQPLDVRLRQVAAERAQNKQRRAGSDPALWADVDPKAALSWLAQAGAVDLIHGHTHRPGDSAIDAGHRRHALTDWDLDDAAAPRAEVLRLDAHGLHRLPPATGS